jgi:hypothetical protein
MIAMSHWIFRVSIALFPICVLSLGASAQAAGPDSADAVLADCGGAALPRSAVDSCLERARILDETNPSPQLQSLEAQLSRQAEGRAPAPPAERDGPPPQADHAPTAIGSDTQSEEPPPPEAYTPYRGSSDSSAPAGVRQDPSGMGGGEPPVQDPDSAPSTMDGNPNSSGAQPNPH